LLALSAARRRDADASKLKILLEVRATRLRDSEVGDLPLNTTALLFILR